MERKMGSGIMLTLLLIGMLTLALNIRPVKAQDPHDVAIVDITLSATEVCVGSAIDINVTAKNNGTEIEPSFDVNTYYDEKLIGTQTVTNLDQGEYTNLTFTWNNIHSPPLALYQDYTIKANASIVADETNTGNNELIDGTVKIKIAGDVDDNQKVDMFDLGTACLAFGADPANLRWDPLADMNGDKKINLMDLALICVNFGKQYP